MLTHVLLAILTIIGDQSRLALHHFNFLLLPDLVLHLFAQSFTAMTNTPSLISQTPSAKMPFYYAHSLRLHASPWMLTGGKGAPWPNRA